MLFVLGDKNDLSTFAKGYGGQALYTYTGERYKCGERSWPKVNNSHKFAR